MRWVLFLSSFYMGGNWEVKGTCMESYSWDKCQSWGLNPDSLAAKPSSQPLWCILSPGGVFPRWTGPAEGWEHSWGVQAEKTKNHEGERESTPGFLCRVAGSSGDLAEAVSPFPPSAAFAASQPILFSSCRSRVGGFFYGLHTLARSLCKCSHQYSSLDPRKVQFYFNKENFWIRGIRMVICISLPLISSSKTCLVWSSVGSHLRTIPCLGSLEFFLEWIPRHHHQASWT